MSDTLARIRQLVGDDFEPFEFSASKVRDTLLANGGNVPATAADLRDLMMDRDASSPGPRYTQRTAALREESQMGAFVGGQWRSYAETGTIDDLPVRVVVGVSENPAAAADDFGQPREDGTYTVPDFAEASYIYIGLTIDTLTTVMSRRDQRGAWEEDPSETELVDGDVFYIWRSATPLSPSWANIELEIA